MEMNEVYRVWMPTSPEHLFCPQKSHWLNSSCEVLTSLFEFLSDDFCGLFYWCHFISPNGCEMSGTLAVKNAAKRAFFMPRA